MGETMLVQMMCAKAKLDILSAGQKKKSATSTLHKMNEDLYYGLNTHPNP